MSFRQDGSGIDLNNGGALEAWPINSMMVRCIALSIFSLMLSQYVVVDTTKFRLTCSIKAEMLNFLVCLCLPRCC